MQGGINIRNYLNEWPNKDLEFLGNCPICRSKSRSLLHANLKDELFDAAGSWTMWRCNDCSSGYLDPRPSVDSVSKAYKTYYTHSKRRKKISAGWVKKRIDKLRKRGRPTYWNSCYGYNLKGGFGRVGFLMKTIIPKKITLKWDHYIRHLLASNLDESLLDIGCGSGHFIDFATKLGFSVTGLEIDKNAYLVAKKSGLDVLEGGLPNTGLEANRFDHVTLNHVVEHLHDPAAGISEAYRLLKSGGRVWLKTPNINALGHDLYGAAWRGLEPPRHLTVMSFDGLNLLLKNAGFNGIQLLEPRDVVPGYFAQSEKIMGKCDIFSKEKVAITRAMKRKASKVERVDPYCHEELTFIAYKT